MDPTKSRIAVVPMGIVPQIIIKSVAAHILGYLRLETDILDPIRHPTYAYDKKRLQYDAGIIIKTLESMSFKGYLKVICILDEDIFIPILTHVYGEAKQGGARALVSISRLKKNANGSNVPMPLLMERTNKIAFHELGHLFDLHHCLDEKCLMSFPDTISTLDDVKLYFCRYCSAFFKDAVKRHVGIFS